ncbi:MAG: DUF4372 domain-containing protein [Verrucomicrobiales bacterium]|nr:DUF4372 domain-containing protein [Verrucomicrobiales bacterium]
MKNKQPATKSKFCVLAQVCNLIPGHLVAKLARKYGIEAQARTFTPWSHVVALLYAQLTHAIGLNDVCDGLRHHAGLLGGVRGAVPPARNTLSHASKTRDSSMMEDPRDKIRGTRSEGQDPRDKIRGTRRGTSAIQIGIVSCISQAREFENYANYESAGK